MLYVLGTKIVNFAKVVGIKIVFGVKKALYRGINWDQIKKYDTDWLTI